MIVDSRRKTDGKKFDPNVDNSIKYAKASGLEKFFWYFLWILIIPMIMHVVFRNELLRSQTKINELTSGIDVQLKKRRDSLVKLLDSAKGFMAHEKQIFTDVTKLRKMSVTSDNRNELSSKTDSIFGRLIAVSENYPELKSNESINNLMDEISYLEREIASSRRLYNREIQFFNQKMFVWPYSVISTSMNLYTQAYFKASDEDKKDVDISFV